MIRMLAVMIGLTITFAALGQAPASAPAGATAVCKDGTYHTGATKSGACSGHKGIKDWFGSTAAKPSGAAPATPATPSTPAAATPSMPTAKAPSAPPKSTSPVAAAGGGAGQVWVNAKTKVYHCSGDRWYGKTKAGEYMTEAAAKTAGNRADHGKACS